MARDISVTLSTGERLAMRLVDAEAALLELIWPGQPKFGMVFKRDEPVERIADEAAWFVEEADRLKPGQFRRQRPALGG